MNFDLYPRTIWLVLSGSRAYGFNNPDSDWDYRGICIPPMDNYIGCKGGFEQAVDGKTKHVWKHFPDGLIQPDSDMQVMELTKFTTLAADCNPSVIETLFCEDVVHQHPAVQVLLDNRDLFLSKRAKARFCGYALSQLARIKLHRKYLQNPIEVPPTREKYGLPPVGIISRDQLGAADSLIKKEIDKFMVDQTDLPEHTKIDLGFAMDNMLRGVWSALNQDPYPIGTNQKFSSELEAVELQAMRTIGFSENFIEVLKKEKQYQAAMRDWHNYQEWKKNRNPARAAMEAKWGLDLKHACHLYRLILMCKEILETGKVHVKRPDAELLRSIRNGAKSYEEIVDFAEKHNELLNESVKKSKLPAHPDMDKINNIIIDMVLTFNKVTRN